MMYIHKFETQKNTRIHKLSDTNIMYDKFLKVNVFTGDIARQLLEKTNTTSKLLEMSNFYLTRGPHIHW